MTTAELQDVLRLHKMWIAGDADGRRADFRNADFRNAYLTGADLRNAYLMRADFRDADLWNADFRGAILSDVVPSWNSHSLLGEYLWQRADTPERKMLSAFAQRQVSWCWPKWKRFNHPEMPWLFRTLAELVRDGDDSPACVRKAKEATP